MGAALGVPQKRTRTPALGAHPATTRLWEGGGQSAGKKARNGSGGCSGGARRDVEVSRPCWGARALGGLMRKTRNRRPCVEGQSRVRRQETSSGSPGAGVGGRPPPDWSGDRRPQGLRALTSVPQALPPRGGHRGATELRGPSGPGRVPGSLPCAHLSSLCGIQAPKATPTPRPRGSRVSPDSRRALFCSESRLGQAPLSRGPGAGLTTSPHFPRAVWEPLAGQAHPVFVFAGSWARNI